MSPLRWAAALAALAAPTSSLFHNGAVTAPCDSPIYCHGELLKAIELARPFEDSKTFVDMPTVKPVDEVIAAFQKLSQPLSNNSELTEFLATYFAPAGGELEEVDASQLHTNPVFLHKLSDPVIREFTSKVIDIWPDLTRKYTGVEACQGCANSYLPVNRTFVVAGGRFREPYYWDSYWILEGLLRTGGAFTEISKNTIENFLDFVDQFGFVPNGARVYYLNRSQPPLLSLMVKTYVDYTNDTSILERAVPLLIKEHSFWTGNRSVAITADDGTTYTLNRYHVDNNQPRPESYREDYVTANNASYYSPLSNIIYPEGTPLNETEKADLYANLASGAESGWDYSAKWLKRPNDAARDVYFPLRSLNVLNLVPVDLNSILYQNEVIISRFLELQGNTTGAEAWARDADKRSEAMYKLMWNPDHWSYFDYNISSSAQAIYIPTDDDAAARETRSAPKGYQVAFNVAQLYPFWTGAAPAQLKHNPLAVQNAYARIESMLHEKVGGIPATNIFTGQQWDEPNVWPPLQHILMQGLLNTPPSFGRDDPAYRSVQNLALRLGQRYLDSTFCTWYATGGSTSETPKLQGAQPDVDGIMFEKYSDKAVNFAGGGGEYPVVEGFGWTNGVLLWAADTFGDKLKRPDCGNITAANAHTKRQTGDTPASAKLARGRSAVELDPWDAKWIKMFGRSAGKEAAAAKKRN